MIKEVIFDEPTRGVDVGAIDSGNVDLVA